MAGGLDCKPISTAVSTCLPPILTRTPHWQRLALDIDGFESLSRPAAKFGSVDGSASPAEVTMPPQELQVVSRKRSIADPTQWWDTMASKATTPQHDDFKHKECKVGLWLINWQRIDWEDPRTAPSDAVVKRILRDESTLLNWHGVVASPESHLEVGRCRKLCEDGRISDAVDTLDLLVQQGCFVPNNLFYRVLKRCIEARDPVLGRRTHALAAKSGYEGDAFLATHLIGLYALHGTLEEAMQVFTKVLAPDAYNWAAIISAYARHGETHEAIRLYRRMCESTTVKRDDRLYSIVLKACATARDLVAGKEVHADILANSGKPDRFVQAGLVNMYAKCGGLEDARRLFDALSSKDVVTWTVMIAGYAQQGMGEEAVNLYRSMQREGLSCPNSVTYGCLLQACASIGIGALDEGKKVHAEINARGLQDDGVLAVSLVHMYAKCGSLEDARKLFETLAVKDVVTWTALIAGYAQGMGQEALGLYRSMQKEGLDAPDSVMYVCLLQACASLGVGALNEGKQLHAQIKEQGLQEDMVLGGSLVNMYAKCGSLEAARCIFDKLPERNVIACNAMIAGYTQQGMGEEALGIYRAMEQDGLTPNSVTFVCLLQACASIGLGALHEGKHLHACIKQLGLKVDGVLGVSLVNMYGKCGSLDNARRVFDTLLERDVVSWNTVIAGYAQQGMCQEALNLYRGMELGGVTPDCVTYVCLLQACASLGAGGLQDGQHLHAQLKEQGLETDRILEVSLVSMYAKCGNLEIARRLFDNLSAGNVVALNALLAGYVQQGMGQDALSLYSSVQQKDLTLTNSVTFICLLQACASVGVGVLSEGKQLHAQIQAQGLEEDGVLGVSLVNMYAKCGRLEEAQTVFNKLSKRDVVAWTSMIAGYAQQGMGQEALRLYRNMQEEGLAHANPVTYGCLLQACASVGGGALEEGKMLHAQIIEHGLQEDRALGVSLVNMYAKCCSLENARSVFENLPERNIVAWNAMIAGYAQQGRGQEALDLYGRMQQEGLTPDSFTYVSLLQACAGIGVGALQIGKKLHAQIKELGQEGDVILGGSLVNMHAKCGNLDDARSMFEKLQERNLVAWNAIISGYAQLGMGHKALSLYSRMQQEGQTPDSVTYVCVLLACASVGVGALDDGQHIHAQIEERRLQEEQAIGVSLVNMYAKCGSIEVARDLFDKLAQRDLVAWNAMIAGYAQQGMSQEALSLHSTMKEEGIAPNSVTYVSLLQACAAVAGLPLGEQLHTEIEERGLQGDAVVGAALVNMYAKCGSMYDSQRVFDSLSERSADAWHALLSGYARQGDSQVVFDLLDRMRLEGAHPNEMTLLSVLTVCSHVGLVDKGREYFKSMRTEYSISATMEHYICMVDLLGRAGHLEEALQMAKSMPFPPSDGVWHTLLGACQKWKNVEIGQQAFKGAVSVDETDSASYVLMSNIYASAQMWEAAKETQAKRMQLKAWKKPGQSWWTDMDGVVHSFVVGDKKHPETESIYTRLDKVMSKIKMEGYVPHLGSSLLDLPDEEKQVELCLHSEKLAIAYALNKSNEGTTIRIIKNLRVCEDCHRATGFISKVEGRTIICRDASRFHVFKEGKCSCGDFW